MGTSPTAPGVAALVLAGGSGRRLGGRDKALLRVNGRRLVDVVAGAAARAGLTPVVAVGPARVAADVDDWVRERTPGTGPVPALAAGLERLAALARAAGRTAPVEVVVLAVDLPGAEAVVEALLRAPLDGHDARVPHDGTGRPQWLAGRYRVPALEAALGRVAREGGTVEGASLRSVLDGLDAVPVRLDDGVLRDVDTPADLSAWQRSPGPRGPQAPA